MSLVYEPSEDSYLLQEVLMNHLKKRSKKIKIIEIGTGSGIQLETLKKMGFKNLSGVDKNEDAINLCKQKGFEVIWSNLFSNIKEKFDLIIFNPPYLPADKREDTESAISTSGGKNGPELINKFLVEAKTHLEIKGKIILLVSNLTKGIDWERYTKRLLVEKKLFFEKLEVWELKV